MPYYLICYDIGEDARRQKVADTLIAAGYLRLQKSVFAGEPSETTFRQLQAWLKKFHAEALQPADSILILPCTQNQLLNTVTIGAPPPDWGLLTTPPNTLII